MKITIHRGAQEIGGSCVELSDANSRIVIDIGMPLVDKDGARFNFADYENLSGPDLVSKDVLPDIRGFYSWEANNRPVDGLLISHAHVDHYGFMSYIRPDVSIYAGAATKKLIDISNMFTPLKVSISHHLPFVDRQAFRCGDFTVTPYLMDHAAFDAYAFLIEAGDRRLVYSGDFRAHGRKPGALKRFLDDIPAPVDAILLEGTSLGRSAEESKNEVDIEDEVVKVAAESRNMMLLCFSSQNVDRLVSFYKASLRTKKIFVVDVYTANILEGLKDFAKIPYPSSRYSNMRVVFPYWQCKRLTDEGHADLMYKFKDFKITKEEITANAANTMMLVRSSMVTDLRRISGLEEATFIYSMWDGYLKESSMAKLLDFVKSKNMRFCSLHTSGHASITTLKKVVDRLKADKIIPIHTSHPDGYKIFGQNFCYLGDKQVLEI